jgi:hypothetical protein
VKRVTLYDQCRRFIFQATRDYEEIGCRDELRILVINFRLLAQTVSHYFRPSNGQYLISIVSRTESLDSSGGTVTRLRAGNTRNCDLISCSTNNFCRLSYVKPDLGPTQAPVQLVLWAPIPEIKQADRKADHSHRLVLILKNEWSFISTTS